MNTIDYDKNNKLIVISTNWSQDNLKKLKDIPTAKYSIKDGTWSVAPEFAFYIADNFYTLRKTNSFLELIAETTLNAKTESDNLDSYLDGSFGAKTLFAHQKEGVKHQLNMQKSIIAADMGTGKTLMALAAVKFLNLPIHVIAPVSLHENWKREASDIGIKLDKIVSASNIGPPPDEDIALIVDECHYFQNEKSNRTKQFLNYVDRAVFLSLLSGTPIKNGRPSNLYPLLVAIRHPIVRNKSFYFNRYCKVKREKGKKPVTIGGSNLIELHNFIKDSFFIKTKKECLDLPEKLRVLRVAEPTDAEQGMFDFVFSALRKRYFERVKTGKIKEGNEALNILNSVRHAASWAKVSTAKTLVQELIEEDRPVVLFMNYKDSAEGLKADLETMTSCAILTSDIPAQQRDGIVQDFQQGKYKVLIATYGTGGVGVTLTAASDVILVDRPWTSGDAIQAEDRCHRIGTTETVNAIWIQNFNVDRKIDNILIEKQKNINEIMTGKRDTLEFNDNISSQAEEILSEIFS